MDSSVPSAVEDGKGASPMITKTFTHFFIAAFLLAAAAACSAPAGSQTAPGNATVFEGALLITGDGSAPIENSAFVVENDQFTTVGRKGQIPLPAGAAHVDLTGKTVMPGKVDMHGHLGYENVIEGTTSKENFRHELPLGETGNVDDADEHHVRVPLDLVNASPNAEVFFRSRAHDL